ncbi:OmpH family outer membrane protein [Dysgonomonas sp. 25]|uniref:OmpH family outer membrane protein n=1 Tax=Dysgonomonas sp. 25 TaxID=2302933 RepID=UPI0013D6EAF1|nr:OmpH family outer membrane protein [Dysgonomonas sp. 25]NDV68471.1 OmpH family outer membrane protein [Dysgonomonas sp. 25]
MKNLTYVINGVLVVAVIILFVLFFTSKNGADGSDLGASGANDSTAAILPVAYVTVDSLLLNYDFAKDANDKLIKRMTSIEANLSKKQKDIENAQAEFNRKVQKGLFLTEERMQQEYARIAKMATDFQETYQRQQNELGKEQEETTIQISDSIKTCIEEYNKTANYEFIFLNNRHDNIIVAKGGYDITDKILTILNQRYAAVPKK